jgi:hypothetical protein
VLLQAGDVRVKPHLNAETPCVVHEPRDELLLEMLERVSPADDDGLGASALRHVGELERDIACADERDARR